MRIKDCCKNVKEFLDKVNKAKNHEEITKVIKEHKHVKDKKHDKNPK